MQNEECRMKNAELRMKRFFKICNLQSAICNLQWGFTLLEVMVAIVILGLGLTMVFELFSGGLRSVEISNDYSNAVILANKKMGELSLKEKLEVGKEEGDFPEEKDSKWEVEIAPYKIDEDANSGNTPLASPEGGVKDSSGTIVEPVKIYRLNIRVFWKKGLTERDVRLTSLRTFVEKPPEEKK